MSFALIILKNHIYNNVCIVYNMENYEIVTLANGAVN